MRPFLWYAILAASGIAAASLLFSAVGGATSSSGRAARVAAEESYRAGATAVAAVGAAQEAPHAPADGRGDHAFYFTRGMYTSGGWGGFGRGGGRWATDWPKADEQFLVVLRRLTNLDAYPRDHVRRLDDPELRRFPFLYILEVGSINLTPGEVAGLRDYMLAGGFVFVDDFWGEREWYPFEEQMKVVLPEHRIVDVPMDHPIFRVFYQIDEPQQMPSIGHWRSGQRTECYGCEIAVRGIFDDDGRLMMLIHWNTDLGDAWEWAEQPDIPLKFTTYAYQIGVNAVVYAMSH